MITVYTTQSCSQCKPVKNYLRLQNIPFEEVDVTDDSDKRQWLLYLTGQYRVPVTVSGDRFVVGFQPAKLKGLL